jgi:hypothetical protein
MIALTFFLACLPSPLRGRTLLPAPGPHFGFLARVSVVSPLPCPVALRSGQPAARANACPVPSSTGEAATSAKSITRRMRSGWDVFRRVPQPLAVPAQAASRHFDFENHAPFDPAGVAPDDVQGAASQTAWSPPRLAAQQGWG